MRTQVALLRGINVGGRNKLPMRELVDVFEYLGAHNVKTYIQSGNVVFQCEEPLGVSAISDTIRDRHGFAPRVFLMSIEQLEQAITANPYPEAVDEPKTLHLYFLNTPAAQPELDAMTALKKESERFHLTEQVFYLHAPNGIGRSKLAERVEKLLGVPTTARNWRSAVKILELARKV
ncbi:MAG: DUF1697 domain-containing protein [Chloroflexota bacterium]